MPAQRKKVLGALWMIALTAFVACHAQSATAAKPQAVPRDTAVAFPDERRLPATPAPVLDIVEIQPFRLKTAYRNDWMQSRPLVSTGLLVVLRVDPQYVVPRNVAEPVLYAGDRTVQRLSQGDRSGYVIGIIPGEINLAAAPIWFGRPQLPERVTPQVIREEQALAGRIEIRPFSQEKIQRATRKAIEAADLAALLRGPAADLVLKYSPDEKHLAETWRLPVTGSAVPRPRD